MDMVSGDAVSGHAPITLDSRYVDLDTPVLLNGIQALVRLLLEQSRLDRAAGHNTAALVSGYRGSPLGGLDKELWLRKALLGAHDIRFQPGLNEDLGATMLWGTQQVAAFGGAKHDGVFGMWYGKGPGVDRSADALRHANAFGTAKLGGVLAVAGDDHSAQSSVLPHQTDQIFRAVMIPLLNPASVADIIEYGLFGLALSRFSGLWAGLKTIAETVEGATTLIIPSDRSFITPTDFVIPPHGLNFDPSVKWPAQRAEIERRLVEERIPAALAFARANGIDRVLWGAPDAPIGIVTSGKGHLDAMRALADLGFSPEIAAARGIALYKIGMSWPLETEGLRRFATGKRALLVVEEKRSSIERQIRDALYNLPADRRPEVAGKVAHDGAPLLPEIGELTPGIVAGAIARFLAPLGFNVAPPVLELPPASGAITRVPFFCAGCPHNSSTVVPEGSTALGGIGCHTMALGEVDRAKTVTQMGAEGVTWIGLAPFTTIPHMFSNMGDGTYQHSGLLAIRQAVTAQARITYKLLYNSAVAMTGGQPVEGGPTVAQIAHQLAAEGVGRIAVVVDDAGRMPDAKTLPAGTERHQRDALDTVQKSFREHEGVGVIIYDQICATEKRRKRKRGTMQVAETSVLINERVCENCGDCTVQSNCVAIEPVATEYGRKRRISPSSCNTDLSCLKGFCPSFVTVKGARKKQGTDARIAAIEATLAARIPSPGPVLLHQAWRGLFAGVGGFGIVTTGATVAMAAHLDGRSVRTLDFTGLAQKNGAVVAHVQIASTEAELDVPRVPDRAGDLLLAADLAVAGAPDVLPRVKSDGHVVGNADLPAVAALVRNPDVVLDSAAHRRALERAVPQGDALFLSAQRITETIFGDAQVMNTLLVGAAWQRGLIPVTEASLLRAIELNGTAVKANVRAFLWGRALAVEPGLADEVLRAPSTPDTLDALVASRAAELVAYQDSKLADRYRALVARAVATETSVAGGAGGFARAVAEGYFHVLAYKDEYEVARLHTDPAFLAKLAEGFEPGTPISFHMAPPLITKVDPLTGRRNKIALPGKYMISIFNLLKRGKAIRGTILDPFGWQADRKIERAAISAFETDIDAAIAALSPATVETATALARLPFAVRGFGPVKHATHAKAEAERAKLRKRLAAPAPARALAVAAE